MALLKPPVHDIACKIVRKARPNRKHSFLKLFKKGRGSASIDFLWGQPVPCLGCAKFGLLQGVKKRCNCSALSAPNFQLEAAAREKN